MEDSNPTSMSAWFHFSYRLRTPEPVIDNHQRMNQAGMQMRKTLYKDPALVSFRCADVDGYAIELSWEAEDALLD